MMVVCEEPYARYRSDEVQHRLRELHYDRTRCGYQLNAVPLEESEEEGGGIAKVVEELRHRAAYLFVTEVAGDFYERFGPTSWGAFMQAMCRKEESMA